MDFWIVAIDHDVQLPRKASDLPERSSLKDQLRALLTREIPRRNVRFVGEEAKLGLETTASQIAQGSSPPIPWKNIDMTESERISAGIAEALKHRPGHPDDETMQIWIECRIPEDEIREEVFIEKTLQNANCAESVLMLLGDMHVDSVGQKLIEMGHRVETNHDLFPIRRWE